MTKTILFLKAKTGMDDPSPPLAFGILSQIAQEKGYKVQVENLNAPYTKKTNQDIVNWIKKHNPDIIGVHIFTNYARHSYKLIEQIKPYSKLIIVGGPHPTGCPDETLNKGADIAVIGEAEISFKKLLKALEEKKDLSTVKGIAFKKNGKVIQTEPEEMVRDLDQISDMNRWIHRKSDYMSVPEEINNFAQFLSTRGCPGRCTYCFTLFNKCFRFMSAQRVFDEIKELHTKHGITHVTFIDDAFSANKKRLTEFCDLLITSKMPITWACSTRVDFLTRENIYKMKEAGCQLISLGIESALRNTLLNTRKTTNPSQYRQQAENILKWGKEAELRIAVNILTGFPWETAEDMKKMQRYVNKIKHNVTQGFYGGILQPQPATEIYNQYAKQYGFEEWWLKKDPLFKSEYHPFFMAYYHQYWDHLHNNFFKISKKHFKELDKLYRTMGRWNLYVFTKRTFKNPLVVEIMFRGVLYTSMVSMLLFNISPKLEKVLMGNLAKLGYRFRYKGNKKTKDK